jgi:hypothetical protein
LCVFLSFLLESNGTVTPTSETKIPDSLRLEGQNYSVGDFPLFVLFHDSDLPGYERAVVSAVNPGIAPPRRVLRPTTYRLSMQDMWHQTRFAFPGRIVLGACGRSIRAKSHTYHSTFVAMAYDQNGQFVTTAGLEKGFFSPFSTESLMAGKIRVTDDSHFDGLFSQKFDNGRSILRTVYYQSGNQIFELNLPGLPLGRYLHFQEYANFSLVLRREFQPVQMGNSDCEFAATTDDRLGLTKRESGKEHECTYSSHSQHTHPVST